MNTRAPIEGELAQDRPSTGPGSTQVAAYQERPASSNPFDMAPAQFAVQIRERGENYQGLVSWLCEHMVIGEDLVQVHVVKRATCEGPRVGCSPSVNPFHWSDPALSKKGAEKICGLLGLGTRFLGMEDFRKAALRGMPIEHVIIDCELYAGSGAAVSQGTGACSLSDVNGDLNNALKKAAKRAMVDAVMRVAGLSGIATEIKRRMPALNLERAQGLPERQAPVTDDTGRAEVAGRSHNTGAALPSCPMGKHKGKPWREIPSDYLEWVVREFSNKPDISRAAAGELTKRRDASAGSSSTRTQQPPPSQEQYDERHPPPPDFDDEIPF